MFSKTEVNYCLSAAHENMAAYTWKKDLEEQQADLDSTASVDVKSKL